MFTACLLPQAEPIQCYGMGEQFALLSEAPEVFQLLEMVARPRGPWLVATPLQTLPVLTGVLCLFPLPVLDLP